MPGPPPPGDASSASTAPASTEPASSAPPSSPPTSTAPAPTTPSSDGPAPARARHAAPADAGPPSEAGPAAPPEPGASSRTHGAHAAPAADTEADDLWPAGTRTATLVRDDEEEDEEAGPAEPRLLRALLGEATLALDATRRARVVGWLWTLGVTLFAGVIRFAGLGRPHELVFDETYYVKDAWSLLVNGYEAQWGDEPNPAFEAGDDSGLTTKAEYVVHPLVGKWIIALGMRLGGGMESSTAWRLAVAVAGTVAVLLLTRIARRMFASTGWGVVAGLFLAVDGAAIVLSRTSLLDPILMTFVLAAFGALILDREQSRRRLAARAGVVIDAGGVLGWGPGLGMRWWRLAAGVLLGLAIGTKWSGIYFLAVFGLLTVAWDMTARRTVGVRQWHVAAAVKDGIVAAVVMVGSALVVYVGSWWSWFTHAGAWGRQWAEQHPGEGVQWLPPALRSLWAYHQEMWRFHNGLETPHDYAAHPLGWIIQRRPTSFYYPTEVSSLTGPDAQAACGADSCSQAIVSLGNPIIWWAGAAAVLVAIVWLLRYRDWRAGAALAGIAAGWLPWFAYAHRTIFTFYSIAFLPWVVLTLVYVLVLVVGPPDSSPRARRAAKIGVGVFIGLVVGVSIYFYPIWTAWVVPYDFWHSHMWLPTWV